MFEECLKNAFPDYPLSSYFCAGEGVGVAVALNEDLPVTKNFGGGRGFVNRAFSMWGIMDFWSVFNGF